MLHMHNMYNLHNVNNAHNIRNLRNMHNMHNLLYRKNNMNSIYVMYTTFTICITCIKCIICITNITCISCIACIICIPCITCSCLCYLPVVNSLVKSTTILYINESHPNVPAAAAASVGNETKTFMASPVSASPSLIASGNKLLACINNWKQPYPLLLHIALAITFLGFLSPSNRRGLLIQYSCFVIGNSFQH